MTSKEIEEAATTAVKRAIITSEYLSPYISENDKEVSWDGSVNIYSNPKKRKSDLIGRVSVQVKGTLKENFSKNEISYPAEVADLKNYLADRGCLYFVVYVSEDLSQERIYYSTLTPVKLYNYLDKCASQKNKSIKLKSLPNDKNRKSTIFLNFYNDCKKQASFEFKDMLGEEDFSELTEITIPVAALGYGSDEIEKVLLENEVHMYGKRKDSDIPIPFRYIPDRIGKVTTIKKSVSVNGRVFYDNYDIIKYKDTTEIHIGNSFTIKISGDDYKVSFFPSSSLKSRIIDTDFFISLWDKKEVEIGGTFNPIIQKDDKNIKKHNIEDMKIQLQVLKNVQETLIALHIQKDIDMQKLNSDDIRWLSILYHAIIRRETIYGLKGEFNTTTILKIGDLNILLFFERKDDGGYVISDFFQDGIAYCPEGSDEDNPFLLSHLSTLRSQQYEKIDNIDYSVFIPAYEKIIEINPDATEYILYDALFMIKAYDNSGKKELLSLADEIFCWLNEIEENPEIDIYLINRLQIAKRTRELTDEETEQLVSISESPDSITRMKAGAHILLGNKKTAEYYINKLDDKEKEEFMSFPIYHLLNA